MTYGKAVELMNGLRCEAHRLIANGQEILKVSTEQLEQDYQRLQDAASAYEASKQRHSFDEKCIRGAIDLVGDTPRKKAECLSRVGLAPLELPNLGKKS